MCLDHPETIPLPPSGPRPKSMEKLSSMKPAPAVKMIGDRCSNTPKTAQVGSGTKLDLLTLLPISTKPPMSRGRLWSSLSLDLSCICLSSAWPLHTVGC